LGRKLFGNTFLEILGNGFALRVGIRDGVLVGGNIYKVLLLNELLGSLLTLLSVFDGLLLVLELGLELLSTVGVLLCLLCLTLSNKFPKGELVH
jgi:hypothetical protein